MDHVAPCRHVVGSNRVLFVLKDGATAWAIKDFLVQQDRCESVTIEGKDYKGKGSPDYKVTALFFLLFIPALFFLALIFSGTFL